MSRGDAAVSETVQEVMLSIGRQPYAGSRAGKKSARIPAKQSPDYQHKIDAFTSTPSSSSKGIGLQTLNGDHDARIATRGRSQGRMG
jgi:hypothetical protein